MSEDKVVPIREGIAEINEAEGKSPEDMLLEALEQIRSGEMKATQISIIALNQGSNGEDYDLHFKHSFMRRSELISLLEVGKTIMIEEIT